MLSIDYQINNWISKYNLDDDNTILNNYLNIGYQVSKLISYQTNDKQLEEYLKLQGELFEEKISNISKVSNIRIDNLEKTITNISDLSNKTIDTNTDKFNQIIEKITGKIHTSSTKGKIAEGFLEQTLKELYPEDIVQVTASTAHESDIQLISSNYPTILIESKNYTNPVPSKEVEKFKIDLDRTNIKFGIFYSFGTTITGKPKFIIESYKDKYILYLPNITFESSLINISVLMIRKIAMMLDNSNNYNKDLIFQKANEIINIIKELDILYDNLSRTKFELVKQKKTIIESLDTIHTTYIENEAIIKNIIIKIKNQIKDKLDELVISNNLNINQNELYKSDDFDNLKTGNAKEQLLYILLTEINEHKFIQIKKTNEGFKLCKCEKEYFDISIKKTVIKISGINTDVSFGLNNSNGKSLIGPYIIDFIQNN